MELAPFGIQVITIEPSLIATPMWETSLALHDDMMKRVSPQAQEFYGQALRQSRAGVAHVSRSGAAPEKVAKVILDALTSHRPKTRYSVS